jgi:hypothetical protein
MLRKILSSRLARRFARDIDYTVTQSALTDTSASPYSRPSVPVRFFSTAPRCSELHRQVREYSVPGRVLRTG